MSTMRGGWAKEVKGWGMTYKGSMRRGRRPAHAIYALIGPAGTPGYRRAAG